MVQVQRFVTIRYNCNGKTETLCHDCRTYHKRSEYKVIPSATVNTKCDCCERLKGIKGLKGR